MGYTNYSYRDQQLQDLDEHRQGCFVFTLFFAALAAIIALCGIIDNNLNAGLFGAGCVLVIDFIIVLASFIYYIKKLKELDE